MSTTVFDVSQIRGPDAVAVGVREIANSCNALVANAGFSGLGVPSDGRRCVLEEATSTAELL